MVKILNISIFLLLHKMIRPLCIVRLDSLITYKNLHLLLNLHIKSIPCRGTFELLIILSGLL